MIFDSIKLQTSCPLQGLSHCDESESLKLLRPEDLLSFSILVEPVLPVVGFDLFDHIQDKFDGFRLILIPDIGLTPPKACFSS